MLVIQVTDGLAEVLREDGFGDRLGTEGTYSFQDPGSTYRIRNAGSTPVGIVLNEARAFR